MAFVQPPESRTVEERSEKAPSAFTAWLFVFIVFAGFAVGGLGIVYSHYWVLWLGAGIFVLGVVFGRLINIMEYTEEQTRTYESGDVERVEPGSEPQHG